MQQPAYVLDTHALVWFVKGLLQHRGRAANSYLMSNGARVVVPVYVLIEILRDFNPKMDSKRDQIRVPPTPLFRLLQICPQVKIVPRSGAVLAWEFRLTSEKRIHGIDEQDIPIAAAAITARDYYPGPVFLVTKDGKLAEWAKRNGVPTLFR